MSQTVNGGQPIEYALDLNSGLTQVLSDGTATYLYGIGRFGEYTGTDWAYYLTDALGYVRKIANSKAGVTLTQTSPIHSFHFKKIRVQLF